MEGGRGMKMEKSKVGSYAGNRISMFRKIKKGKNVGDEDDVHDGKLCVGSEKKYVSLYIY